MQNKLVPINDLPEELVPQSDLSEDVKIQGESPTFELRAEKTSIPKDVFKSFISSLGAIPRSAGKFSSEKLRPLFGKEPLSEEQLQEVYKAGGAQKYSPKTWQGEIGSITGDIAPYLAIPQATIPKLMLATGAVEGAKAYGENKNPLLSGLLSALAGGVTAGGIGLVGKATNWMAGIPQDVAERAVNPASKTLDVAKSKDTKFELQDAWDDILGSIRSKTGEIKEEAGQKVGKAKELGFESTKSLAGVQSKLSTKPYTDIIKEISSNRPQNIKISTKERDLNKYIKDYLETRNQMTPQEIQSQMDLLDTDFINWEAGLGKTKSISEKNAIKAAKKVRNLMNEDLIRVTGGEGGEYATAKADYSMLLDLLSKGKTPQITQANELQAINLLRQLEKPNAGSMRKALQELEAKSGQQIIEPTRDILASEELSSIFAGGEKGRPNISKALEWLPQVYAKNIGMPYQKTLNKIIPKNKELIQRLIQATTAVGVDGNIPAEQYRNRK